MPDTEENKTVPIDTSGPDTEIDIEEKKQDTVIETEAENQETEITEQEEVKEKTQDENLEDYSKGVQSRIAKLTRKMREAERREQAAIDYAKGVEDKLRQAHIRVSTDVSASRMNAKIRDAQMQKVPYVLVVGDKEMEAGTVAVRLRGKNRQLGVLAVDDFVAHVEQAVTERALE